MDGAILIISKKKKIIIIMQYRTDGPWTILDSLGKKKNISIYIKRKELYNKSFIIIFLFLLFFGLGSRVLSMGRTDREPLQNLYITNPTELFIECSV